MLATTLFEHPWPPLQWGSVLGASLAAAHLDLRSRRIPNVLTAPLLAGGLLSSAVACGWPGLAESLLATVLLALPYVLLYAFAGGGAGDAKLMGAIGAWLGLVQGGVVLFAVASSGVLLAFLLARSHGELALVGGRVRTVFHLLAASFLTRSDPRQAFASLPPTSQARKMPYGVAIFVGLSLAALGVNLCAS
jgi:prepilin peptidase CpaA